MSNELNFETYLLIENKKFVICVIEKSTFETIYSEQILLNDNDGQLKFEILDEFIEKNIFKIEKILKNFIKKIFIVLKSKDYFHISISTKKENYGNVLNLETLLYPLNDLKNLCQSNFRDKKIIHMIIENYQIGGENFFSLPKNLNCDTFSIEVKFICLPKNLIERLEVVLKKYHISINQILCGSYIENFVSKNQSSLFETASRIKSGLNENEVLLVGKSTKNKGFFEKFFDFFK